MASQSQQNKKNKKSTTRLRLTLNQAKLDLQPLFRSWFDGEPASVYEWQAHMHEPDPAYPVIVYLSKHLLKKVQVSIMGIEMDIVPIMIGTTSESIIKLSNGPLLINPSRMAIHFLYDDSEMGMVSASCLVGAIKIKKQNKQEKEVEITKTRRGRIEL